MNWGCPSQKTLLGLNLNGGADRFEEGAVSLQFNQVQASFSAMHFLTDIIGKGLFLRGDIGLGVLSFFDSLVRVVKQKVWR